MARKKVNNRSAISVILLVIGGFLLLWGIWNWWNRLYSNPERVFWTMVGNNLQSRSMIKSQADSTSDGSNYSQVSLLVTSPELKSESHSTLTQPNGESTSATIKTETIGTSAADFARYTVIDTGGSKSEEADQVLGKWGQQETGTDSRNSINRVTTGALLNIFPVGSLSYANRAQLLEFMQVNGVYGDNIAAGIRQNKNGRPVYVYHIELSTTKYAAMLQKYADALGFGSIAGLDPSQFDPSATESIDVTVDIISRQLDEVAYSGQGRTENYSAFGIKHQIVTPTDAIPLEELLQKLSAIFGS